MVKIDWNEVFGILFGDMNLSVIIVGLIMAIVGIFFSAYVDTKSRNKTDPRTPEAFSWTFWLKDNVRRVFLAFFLTFFLMRILAPEFGKDNSLAIVILGFTCGMSTDLVAIQLRKYLRSNLKSKFDNETKEGGDTQ